MFVGWVAACGPSGPAGDGDASAEGGEAPLAFEPCKVDAECPGSAPVCVYDRVTVEDGEVGSSHLIEMSLCTRACEQDADCGAGADAPRCVQVGEDRRCALACAGCSDAGLECADIYFQLELCANVTID